MIIASTPEALRKFRDDHPNKTIALGTGVFDLVHEGHAEYLQSVKHHAMGGLAVIAVLSDEGVRARKGPDRPVRSQDQRAAFLSKLTGLVDGVVIRDYFPEDSTMSPQGLTMLGLIEALRPDRVVADHSWERHADEFAALGAEFIAVDNTMCKEDSTTNIIQRIRTESGMARFEEALQATQASVSVPIVAPTPRYI